MIHDPLPSQGCLTELVPPKKLTVEQIAEEWQVSKSTVYDWCRNPRELKRHAFKVGKHVRVDPEGYETWKQKKRRGD